MRSRICVVGAGRSGAVTAACLAELGHDVRAVDVNAGLVAALSQGRAPFHEPGLDELLQGNLAAGRLSFTTSADQAVPRAAFVLLCVDTPAGEDGQADLSSVWAAARDVAPLLEKQAIVVTRSTVPVGTNARLLDVIRAEGETAAFEVVSNPEFLREGHAVDDLMRPERIVIGARSRAAAEAVAGLYEGIDTRILLTDLETAEVIKYAANAYLATSVSFINEIANICERVGADVALVSDALQLDSRIGPRAYLTPGIGFGGSCLPKDLRALAGTAEQHGYDPSLVKSVIEVNERQPERIVDALESALGGLTGETIAVLGLSFKGGTLDLRSSPALAAVRLLLARGARVRAFDPLADGSEREALPGTVELAGSAYDAAAGAAAAIIATDHAELRELDLGRLAAAMTTTVLVDGRSLLDREAAEQAGFVYIGVGRPRRRD